MASTEFATRTHKGSAFLFLLGFALIAVGAGFAFAPQYSWQVTRIARQAAAMGLENGALFVGGLVVIGLGIVARISSPQVPTHDSRGELEALQSELHLLNEQVSTKLAQLRTALMQIHESVTAVASQQQAQLQTSQDKPVADHSQDAVFRLAASLDKLHAHFDERVHAVDLQLRSGFEAVIHASQDLRRHLEQGGFPSESYQPEIQQGGAFDAAAPSQGGPRGHAPEGGIDFFETMQKLDAISGEPMGNAPQGHRGHHPQAPFPSQGQGESLDALLPEEYRDRY